MDKKRKHPTYIAGGDRIYCCKTCHSHLLSQRDVISRAFHGRHGPAYLVDSLINVSAGVKEDRMLLTGMHTVADVSCNVCATKLGWRYLEAAEESQKYKEMKYIVEKAKISRETIWQIHEYML
ncbi:hypothetical protein O0I10_001095 [Lichtheimia ornata]|uniref:Protein yippee-like n=1 Tax=Lichtheimia ornata TaxID=688661 RepID=A0AAD7Y344_9FUNG|nr:uncharacterized protein O0I10_001095 [Lichtheimia ornata]KAJ8662919.1 hypothetical protein O0I10_001095 [Lichtheimia ornata]